MDRGKQWAPNRSEYEAIMWLAALQDACKQHVKSIEKRSKAAKCWRKIRSAQGLLASAELDLLATMPGDAVRRLSANLKNVEAVVKIRDNVTGKAGYEGHFYVAGFPLARLCREISALRCLMCELSEKEQRKCKVRQDLHDLLPWEDDTLKGTCPYIDRPPMEIGHEEEDT